MGCLGSSSRRTTLRRALVFALVTCCVLAVQIYTTVAVATECEARRRPYVWMGRGYGCLLVAANLGTIITWIIAAARDMALLMHIGSTAMYARSVGLFLYAAADYIRDWIRWRSSSLADVLHDHVEFCAEEYLFTGLPTLAMFANSGVEAFFVNMLVFYQAAFGQRHVTQEAAAVSAAPPPPPPEAASAEVAAAEEPAESDESIGSDEENKSDDAPK